MDTLEQSYRRVSSALDFPAADLKCANHAYARWRDTGSSLDKQVVDVWTYCNVVRYFQRMAGQRASISKPDRDMLVDNALVQIGRAQKTLRQTDRYAAWVLVICRNVFVSYLRQIDRINESIEPYDIGSQVDDPNEVHEKRDRQAALRNAIDRLPPFLATVMRMRFLEDLPYAEISEKTGKPVEILRAYVSKSISRLRKDRLLFS